jgi:pimeloyl-ACP methyl ester carboxylesterase
MEKKFIEIGSFRLCYVENNPESSRTIFFIHGNSGSFRSWIKQWESPLFESFRLIAIELPGHGRSSDSSDALADYSPASTGAIMAAAVKKLIKGDSYSFVGFSYGTNLIAEMLNYGLKPYGIALIGSCVAGAEAGPEKILNNPASSIYFHDDISTEQAAKFLKDRIKDPAVLETYLEDYMNTRKPFRSSLLQSAMQGKYSDEIALLRKLQIPLLVVFGLEDDLVMNDYLDRISLTYWNDTIYKLPGCGHYVQIDQAEKFNSLLLGYLEHRSKQDHSSMHSSAIPRY